MCVSNESRPSRPLPDPFRSASSLRSTNFQFVTNCPCLDNIFDFLSFQSLPNRPVCKSFVLACRGVYPLSSSSRVPYTLHAAFSSLFSSACALFRFTYALSPLLPTLTKTAGVCWHSSRYGTATLVPPHPSTRGGMRVPSERSESKALSTPSPRPLRSRARGCCSLATSHVSLSSFDATLTKKRGRGGTNHKSPFTSHYSSVPLRQRPPSATMGACSAMLTKAPSRGARPGNKSAPGGV